MSDDRQIKPRGRSLVLVPFILFVSLALVFWWGLSGDPSAIPSTMIGKPVPAFQLAALEGSDIPGFASADLKGRGVSVVNVFASWCVPCREEHPLLVELAKRPDIRLLGINNKDKPQDALRFLGKLGQPYAAIGSDSSGRVSIDWGVYGVPETFIVDNEGVIRYKLTGPMSPDIVEKIVTPEIEKAQKPKA